MSVTAVPIQPVKRSYIWWIVIGIAVALGAAFLLARQGDADKITDSGLRYRVVTEGTGPHPTDADMAIVMYEGRLPNGEVFDRSQQPAPLPVAASDPAKGVDGVVPGFSEALKLMSKGARYHFVIPAKLGYGASPPQGSPIPPNSPLIFDVQLLGTITVEQYRQYMMQQMMMGGGGAGGPGGPGGPPGGPGGAGAPGGPGGATGEPPAPGGDTEKPAPKGAK